VKTLPELFKIVAPDFDFKPILSHLEKTFSALEYEEFKSRTNECLKFLYLRSCSGRGFIPLSGEVDDIWHAFILQTKEYADFCHALPGKTFIHHNSISIEDYTEEVTKEVSVQRLLEWIPAYIEHFGPFTENAAKYWMIIQLLQNEFDYNLDEINQLH
jgi:hypothetical protein